MNIFKTTSMWITVIIQICVCFGFAAGQDDKPDANTSKSPVVRDYEAAKTIPQPIDLWKVKKFGCGGNPRTAKELKKMQTYGYSLELVCPLIDGAAKYVAQIKGVRGCGELRSFESETNFFHLDELSLPPGRYQWAASVYTEEGEWLGDVEVIEPVEIFCVAGSTPLTKNGKKVLLDLKHTAGHIRGWGYYNHAHYMIKELLEKAGFQVKVNEENLLTPEKLDGIDLLVMNYYWVGWPGFRAYLNSELSAVRKFVQNGGALLVAGCDRPDGGGKMVKAGNQFVSEFGLNFVLLDPANKPGKAKVVDNQGIISFANPLHIQLPVAVDGRGHPLLALEDIPVAKSIEYGKGRLVVAGVGMSFLDCYLGDCESREPFHLLLFYDFIRYLTDVDWISYCDKGFVDQIFNRSPNFRLRK